MVTDAPGSMRDRIGGRWAVSWQGYLFLLPLSVFFILTTTPAIGRELGWGVGLLIGVVSYAATGLVLWLSSVTVLRQRGDSPAPVAVVAFVGGVAWAARSAVLGVSIQVLDVSSTAALPSRLVFGFAMGAVAVPSIALLLDNLDRFRRRRSAVLTRLVEEEVAAGRLETYVSAMRLALVDEVSVAVKNASSGMATIDLSSASMPREALSALEQASTDAVRQVSHETWEDGQALSRLRIGEVLRVAAANRPFQWWGLAVVLTFGLVVVARVTGWSEAFANAVVLGVYAGFVIALTNRVCSRRRNDPLSSYLVGLAGLALSGPLLLVLDSALGRETPNITSLALLTSGAFIFVVPLTGLARAVDVAEDEALARLRESVSDVELRSHALDEQERRLRRELAIRLHGTVGANLTAATMRMRNAVNAGDVEAATDALFEARRLLDVDLSGLLLVEASDLGRALTDLVDSWAGIVDVVIDAPQDLALSPSVTAAVVDVVGEGISNASRHGGAVTVQVSVTGTDVGVHVVVVDDGRHSSGKGAGLGSRMLDERTPGRWSFTERPEGGSRLEATIVSGV